MKQCDILERCAVFRENISNSMLCVPGQVFYSLDCDFFICKLREGIELNPSSSKKTSFQV